MVLVLVFAAFLRHGVVSGGGVVFGEPEKPLILLGFFGGAGRARTDDDQIMSPGL